jgi:hypothetical protein
MQILIAEQAQRILILDLLKTDDIGIEIQKSLRRQLPLIVGKRRFDHSANGSRFGFVIEHEHAEPPVAGTVPGRFGRAGEQVFDVEGREPHSLHGCSEISPLAEDLH